MTICQTENKKGEKGCQLLDGFALLVQLLLAVTALLLLLYKRQKEKPKRPFSIWCLDVSKQFISAGLIHCINIEISYLSSSNNHHENNNMCVWYLLSVFWDTTFGLLLLYIWLHTLQWIFKKWGNMTDDDFQTYGSPPLFFNQFKKWFQQTIVFLMAELLMKLCQLWCFQFSFLFYLGQWFLSLFTSQNYHFQVFFVMFLYPLIMNGIQFWTIDTIIQFNKPSNEEDDLTTNQKWESKHADESTFTTLYDHVVIHLPNERSPLLSTSS
ncbi:unnamed protein product [Cunninghamella blakesleeana]